MASTSMRSGRRASPRSRSSSSSTCASGSASGSSTSWPDRETLVKKILLADDESNLRKLVRTTLEDPAYQIFEAPNGSRALELARKEVPDLLLLDWMMPGMTGIEVLKALRSDRLTA